MFEQHSKEIQIVIADYFNGIFYGDIEKLKSVFHSQALLFGDINGQPYFKTLADYIEGVKTRKSPNELNEVFKMNIISIEIMNHVAYAKLHCPMLGYNYYDYLSLNKIDERWVIVNKVFTHIGKD